MHIMYIYTNMQVDRQTCCCSLLSFPHMKVLKHLGIICRTKKITFCLNRVSADGQKVSSGQLHGQS